MSLPETDRGFHISVGVAPHAGTALEAEAKLLKPALLYGDRVTLYSPNAAMVQNLVTLSHMGLGDLFTAVAALIPEDRRPAIDAKTLQGIELVSSFEKLPRRLRRNPEGRRLNADAASVEEALREQLLSMAADAGLPGLRMAEAAGLLGVHAFDRPFDAERVVQDFADSITRTVEGGATYPLLDDETGSLIQSLWKDGQVRVSEGLLWKAKVASLASNLLQRLPLFSASFSEILDVRKELSRSLAAFRGAMAKFGATLRAEAWDSDFPIEAEKLFVTEVAPTIQQLEDQTRSNSYLKELVPAWAKHTMVVEALGLVVSAGTSLAWSALAVGSATAAYEAYTRWKEKAEKVEQNQLFLLYRIRQRLTDRG